MRYMIQLVCLFLVGCASSAPIPQMPPVPGDPPSPTRRNVTIFSRAQPAIEVVTPPIVHTKWTWDYPEPMPADNIAFDFEGSTDLINWYLIVTTNQPPVSYDVSKWNEYFRVAAHWIVPPPDTQ